MSVNESSKVDLLWKKVGFGVTETATAKTAGEENVASPITVMGSTIWRQDHLIPQQAAAVPGIVASVNTPLMRDPSVADGTTWFAIVDPLAGLNVVNRVVDFIPFTMSPDYEVKVFKDAALTQRMLPNAPENGWVFDYTAGVLWFPNGILDETVENLFVTGFQYIGQKGLPTGGSGGGEGSGSEFLLEPSEGSFVGGFIDGWQPNETTLADAIDQINRSLNLFKPAPAPSLAMQNLEIPGGIQNRDGIPIVLSASTTDSTGEGEFKPVPGQQVRRVVGLNAETNIIGPFGPGRSGTVSAILNNEVIGTRTLTVGNDAGVYGKLVVVDDQSYPIDRPGFNESITARVSNFNPVAGLNQLVLRHTEGGETNTLYFVRESDLVKPTVDSLQVDVNLQSVNIVMSSGVPHYTDGTSFTANASVQKLATDVTLSTQNVEFETHPINVIDRTWALPGMYGLPEVLTKDASYEISGVPLTINMDTNNLVHKTLQVKAIARNANGITPYVHDQKINVMMGSTPTGIGPVSEQSVPIHNLGALVEGGAFHASRILLPESRTPQWPYGTEMPEAWDSFVEVPSHEAIVVGGVIQYANENFENYSPAGPDYSGRTGNQYITFAIRRRNVSKMLVQVVGKYSGMWVKLPGIAELPLVQNGWWGAKQMYQGFGTPGRDVPDGCALGEPAMGGAQDVAITFGQESSSNSANNLILVRFQLVPGDAITGLRFSGISK